MSETFILNPFFVSIFEANGRRWTIEIIERFHQTRPLLGGKNSKQVMVTFMDQLIVAVVVLLTYHFEVSENEEKYSKEDHPSGLRSIIFMINLLGVERNVKRKEFLSILRSSAISLHLVSCQMMEQIIRFEL
jgi:hypothetical protein